MSAASLSVEILSPRPSATGSAGREPSVLKFDELIAVPFILKSLSAETRESYRRGIQEFFRHAGWPHPTQVTLEHVLRYCDRLVRDRRRPATVAQKLSVVRSFFSYLQVAGVVALNPASTKLVPPPPMPAQQAGRALTPKEVRHLLTSPDKTKPEGAGLRDAARHAAAVSAALGGLLAAAFVDHGEPVPLGLEVQGQRRRDEVWPLPADVKEAIDDYLRLDRHRRRTLHSDGPYAPLFQPHSNYRTLVFDKALSPWHVQRIMEKWGRFSGVGKVNAHDLRRTVVKELLNRGHSYREVQMVTKHRDPKTVMRYDQARENLENKPINTFGYEE